MTKWNVLPARQTENSLDVDYNISDTRANGILYFPWPCNFVRLLVINGLQCTFSSPCQRNRFIMNRCEMNKKKLLLYSYSGSSQVSLSFGSVLDMPVSLFGQSACSPTLKMEATCTSENSADFQRATRRYIPEDGTFQGCMSILRLELKKIIKVDILLSIFIIINYGSSYTQSSRNSIILKTVKIQDICIKNRTAPVVYKSRGLGFDSRALPDFL
jgi:hypothetical protein